MRDKWFVYNAQREDNERQIECYRGGGRERKDMEAVQNCSRYGGETDEDHAREDHAIQRNCKIPMDFAGAEDREQIDYLAREDDAEDGDNRKDQPDIPKDGAGQPECLFA